MSQEEEKDQYRQNNAAVSYKLEKEQDKYNFNVIFDIEKIWTLFLLACKDDDNS